MNGFMAAALKLKHTAETRASAALQEQERLRQEAQKARGRQAAAERELMETRRQAHEAAAEAKKAADAGRREQEAAARKARAAAAAPDAKKVAVFVDELLAMATPDIDGWAKAKVLAVVERAVLSLRIIIEEMGGHE